MPAAKTATALKKKALRAFPRAEERDREDAQLTPAALGFRMPAEWEPHAATWLAWPHNREDWPGKFQGIQYVYVDIVRHLSRVEQVEIVVNDAPSRDKAAEALTRSHVSLSQVRFHLWPTNRIWTRDSGPIFVKRELPKEHTGEEKLSRLAVTNWRFNGWAKYPNWQLDDQLPARVAKLLKLPEYRPLMKKPGGRECRVVLEGGSIDANGRGTLLTTEECLLSPVQQRNPGLSREDIEKVLHDHLGIRKVIWLGCGIAGDDTHGHVDDITRFVAPDVLVSAVEPDTSDYNHAPLEDNLRRLRSATDQDGNPLRIVKLPLPSPVMYRGQRLPASYANFYIANRMVLVPTFNDKNDRTALNILADLFSDREVIGIHCGDFIWGLGALHCMTQQQPVD